MCNHGIGVCLRSSSSQSESDRSQNSQSVSEMESSVVDDTSTPRVKFLCSFGGSILPRPLDGKLRYVGGETRIVSLSRDITYNELMSKMRELFEGVTLLKYQQPDEDIDALVSVVNDDDVTNMMEECDKLGAGDSFTRLRIFLFSHPEHDVSLFDTDERESERRYVDALNNPTDVPDIRKPPEISVAGQLEKLNLSEQQFFNPTMFDRYHKEAHVGAESCEGSILNQRNCDVPLPLQYNLHRHAIPHQPLGHCNPAVAYQDNEIHMQGLAQMKPCGGSVGGREGHHQQLTQRYNEIENPWGSGYYSSGHQVHHDPRAPLSEFPNSPSANPYRVPFGDLHDKGLDRLCDEYGRQPESGIGHTVSHYTPSNHHITYEHPPSFVDNMMWIQQNPMSGDNAGFQGHLNHPQGVYEGNSICDRCHMAFQRSQAMSETRYPDSRWRQGQHHMERSGSGNEISQLSNPCAECLPGREAFVLNPDTKLDHSIYAKDQNESCAFYNDVHNHERGWVLHQLNHRVEEQRTHLIGAGRANEHYIVDDSMGIPFSHNNCCESHSVSSNCINRDDPRYVRSGAELGNEGLHDQNLGVGSHMHRQVPEDSGIRYGNFPSAFGDNLYQVSHGSPTVHALPRKALNGLHAGTSYEVSGLMPQLNDTASASFLRVTTREGSPRLSCIGVDDQNPWTGQSGAVQKTNATGFDTSIAPEYLHDHMQKLNLKKLNFSDDDENRGSFTASLARGIVDSGLGSPGAKRFGAFAHYPRSSVPVVPEPIQLQSDLLGLSVSAEAVPLVSSSLFLNNEDVVKRQVPERNAHGEVSETNHTESLMESNTHNIPSPDKSHEMGFYADGSKPTEENVESLKPHDGDTDGAFEQSELSVQYLSFIPELMASVKRAALEGVEEVKASVHANDDAPGLCINEHAGADNLANSDTGNLSLHELEPANPLMELEGDSGSDYADISKIEPTKAEAEALARGLQTIKNDDLEEIRELGSGTYGAVYHGKWKGSDVAIKRIKASCFAGKPSERERLIADFWKEALILSSLHHPNVVSFYGIVRDGPDGSLATVTEFMVNGSLKQFLQKKDRTIDRRKRLIIAMDAAFGMEYLHGKNIVHFDLKCENLLVNMRDPHRPVCKIGDLGLSKVKQHTLVSGGVRGTLPWMAPELLSGKSNMVTEKIDVYSFGIVMWELLTGEEPYADRHCASIIGGIVNNSLRPQIPTWCDPEWRSLMESCWSSDPGERPSFSEISQKLRKMSAAINVK